MAPHKTITVNGRVYDAVTGLPVDEKKAPSTPPKKEASVAKKATPKPAPKAARPAGTPRPDFVKVSAQKARPPKTATPAPAKKAPATPRAAVAAGSVHGTVQRSQTLNRRAAQKPAPVQRPLTRRKVAGKTAATAATHTDVARFAKHPETKPAPKAASVTQKDTPAQTHPVADRAMKRTQASAKKKAAPVTAKQVKDQAISKALATRKAKPVKRSKKQSKHLRKILIIAGIVVVVLLALFAVYRLVPSISVNVAAAQAGVAATYPEFTPDGYHLSQPVEYSDGEVELKFESNSNDNYYTITQTNSSWDSTAVLDSVVTPAAGADYVTTKERGLTIYTYDSSAVWVNGGILYQIDSQAPLSGDQIRRIATSL